jgi:anti-sigma regulatory factor (Ser/Thr protein kinase)
MRLRIIDIDLDAARVHLEVAPDGSEESFSRLDSFVSRCADEGIYDVRVYHRRGTSKRDISRLVDFVEMKRFQPPAQSPTRSDNDSEQYSRFRSELRRPRPGSKTERQGLRYQICADELEHAVERLHTMTALVCASENLDPRSTLLLRLCVYELASNSVEHGTFTTDSPTICLGLTFSDDRVSVKYRDNADVFLTNSASEIDLVAERINTSSKRGLGLYMLNKICVDFEYERTDDWNITSFSLDLSRDRESVTKR